MIDFEVVDEEMRVVRPVGVSLPAGFIQAVSTDHPDWKCLPGIDPYGLTFFNQVQIKWLMTELDSLLRQKEPMVPRESLLELRDAAEWVSNEVHTYLRCVGD